MNRHLSYMINFLNVWIDISDQTTKFGKGNVQDTTTGHTIEKSKESDNSECSEEIDNEGVIIAPCIEDHEKKNLQKENQ